MAIRNVISVLFVALSWICRILAIGFAAATVVLCFSPLLQITPVADVVFWLNGSMPDAIAGLYVDSSAFGGAFRGDFAIVSVLLFIGDWACLRVASVAR